MSRTILTSPTFAILLALAGCQASDREVEPVASRTLAINTSQSDSFFSDANRWNVPEAYLTIQYPDVNGDLRSDVCGRRDDGIWCATDNGASALTNAALWNGNFSNGNGWNQAQYYSTIQFPDVNGDGKADMCARGIAGILCGSSNGSSFAGPGVWSSLFSDANGWASVPFYSTIRFPDLNGDGKADVCGRGKDAAGNAGIWCALSSGSGFGSATRWNTTFGASSFDVAQYYSTIQFADVNGDGKADLCGRGPGGGAGSAIGIWCATSNGSTFGTPSRWNTTFGDSAWDGTQYFPTIQFADVNADKAADLCGRGPGGGSGSTVGIWCGVSSGTGFAAPTLWNTSIGNPSWDPDFYARTIHVRDGAVCGRGTAGVYCAYSNGTSFVNELLESSNESNDNGWTDPQYYRTMALTRDYKLAERGSAGIWTAPASRDNLSIGSVTQLNARRTALIKKVWARTTVDTLQGVDEDAAPASIDVTPLPAGVTVRRYKVNMPTSGGIPDANDGAGANVQGLADHFIPAGGSTRLVILNPGHTCNYSPLPYQDAQTVIDLLNDGYAVLATYMPGLTPLSCIGHDQFWSGNLRPANGGNPLLYFLDPVRRALNYAISQYGYTRVDMAGLSGGGWTTTFYAALDTRVKTSIPIAGSEPVYMRPWHSLGSEMEQENDRLGGNDFFSFPSGGTPNTLTITEYKDLYVLGAYGAGRRQVQVLNRNDDCCFGAGSYTGTGVVAWDQSVRNYELEVRQRLAALGAAAGSFRVEINEADDDCSIAGTCPNPPARHEFSKNTRVNVLLSELNGNAKAMATPTGVYPFTRAANGHLQRNNSGQTSWSDSGLAIVGTPAVIVSALNPLDVFYRDNTNQLVHARYNGSSWQALTDIGGRIISDPVAVSTTAGRIDVVALGPEYKLFHWWGAGSWAAEVISTGSTLAVGQPTLTSFSQLRLDIYFRGHDSKLYHAFSTVGAQPFTLETASNGLPNGGVIKSFATAATSSSQSSLWAYATGRNGHLYQMAQTNGGSWLTTDVSLASGSTATSVLGTPSVFRSSNGTRSIYARVGSGAAGVYTPSGSSWTFTNRGNAGVSFVGSPSASDLGAFFNDDNRATVLSTSTGFTGLGGYSER